MAAAVPLLGRAGEANAAGMAAATFKPGPGRGLLFDAEDIPRIRANLASPRFAELRAIIFPEDMAGNERFLRDEIRLENLVVDMARARQLLERAALAYVVSGDARQLALAKLALGRLCDYERWDYFLEGGHQTVGLQRASEATIACCLALDWLGAELTPEERERAEHNIATKGAPACYASLYGMKYPDRVRGWTLDPRERFGFTLNLSRWPLILNATNLKVIPTCGLGYAGIALQGRHPDAAKWLDLARQSARAYAGSMVGADGSFDEGIGYWSYTLLHLALFAEALYRRTGTDDRALLNYPGTVRYALHMAMPTLPSPPVDGAAATPTRRPEPAQDTVNFGDASRSIDVTIAPWVARTQNDALSAYVGHEIGGLKQFPAAIWYRPDAIGQAPGPDLFDVRMLNDLVISRTGWRAEDGVLALRSGGPSNHEHADRNSVIFKAHGERLFHDPFHAAYAVKDPRWLLRLTEAHTAVLVGGKGHQYHDGSEGTNASWASARIVAYRTGEGWMTVTSDATEAYALVNPAVTRVERTLVYLKPDVLLVLDRVRVALEPMAMQVRFQVYNDDGHGRAEARVDGFAIARPHATLQATFQGVNRLGARTGALDLPAKEGVFPFVEVESAPALEHAVFTVCTAQRAGEAHGALAVAPLSNGWRVTGAHNGRPVAVTVTFDGEAAPAVAL